MIRDFFHDKRFFLQKFEDFTTENFFLEKNYVFSSFFEHLEKSKYAAKIAFQFFYPKISPPNE